MNLELASQSAPLTQCPGLKIVAVDQAGLSLAGQELDTSLGNLLNSALKEIAPTKLEESDLWVTTPAGPVWLVGLGDPKLPAAERLRRAGAKVSRGLTEKTRIESATLELFGVGTLGATHATLALAEGILLGSYSPKPKERNLKLQITGAEPQALQKAQILARGVNRARRLVNTPPNILTPAALAAEAQSLATELGLEITVWDPEAIQARGLGGLWAVGKGSANLPRFISLRYRHPEAKDGPLALVGKGLCFDTGGLTLKPLDSMKTMKSDMSGAAAALGTIGAVAELGLPIELRVYIAAAENSVGPEAYRVDDVITMYDGTTVEVTNTDAEGRITLADAISIASGEGAREIVELSTLTGACVVALGPQVAGLFTRDPGLEMVLRQAAQASGEKLWPLPLEEDYLEFLQSPVADLKNTGARQGGAIQAGLFLQHFAKVPFAHLDIAGPAFFDKPQPLGPEGGSGFGVRTLVNYLESRAGGR